MTPRAGVAAFRYAATLLAGVACMSSVQAADRDAASRQKAVGAAHPGADARSAHLESLVQYAVGEAQRRAPAGAKAPVLVRAGRVTWPNAALGCAVPGRAYADMLSNGYRIQVRSGTATLDYHAGERNPPLLCPAERAGKPVSNELIK